MNTTLTNTAVRFSLGLLQLFLGVWVGGLIMTGVAAAVTFPTLRTYEPERFAYLAGGVINNVFRGLGVVQAMCALVVVVCYAAQSSVLRHAVRRRSLNVARGVMIVLAVAAAGVTILHDQPEIWRLRELRYDATLDEAAQNAAKDQLMALHHRNQWMLGAQTILLVAAAIVTPFAVETRDQDHAK